MLYCVSIAHYQPDIPAKDEPHGDLYNTIEKPALLMSLFVGMSDYITDLVRLLNEPPAASDGDRMFREPYKYAIKRIFESFADLIPADWIASTHPFLYLVLWHLRILSYLCFPQPHSEVLLDLCRDSAALLISNAELVTP